MRVIAGKARRVPLKTLEGMDTRPTQDRIKETLFNMLQYDLADCCFLDLFAGSGGIGIEALSRGAGFAVFVSKGGRDYPGEFKGHEAGRTGSGDELRRAFCLKAVRGQIPV